MYCLSTKVERKSISDETIIRLYNNGWAINDIVAQHKASVRYVRCVLQAQGVDTASYRAAPDFLKKCIISMISTGLPVRKVAETIDVSPHLVRQVLRNNQTNASVLRSTQKFSSVQRAILDSDWSHFLKLYQSGTLGFMKCAERCNFTALNCLEAVLRLDENTVAIHREKLFRHIAANRSSGLSAASVGKQIGVSHSIVKITWASMD